MADFIAYPFFDLSQPSSPFYIVGIFVVMMTWFFGVVGVSGARDLIRRRAARRDARIADLGGDGKGAGVAGNTAPDMVMVISLDSIDVDDDDNDDGDDEQGSRATLRISQVV